MGWARKMLSVAASLVGLATGTTIGEDAAAEREREQAARPRLESAGYAASGANFYVWEEDSQQARSWAEELSRLPPSESDS